MCYPLDLHTHEGSDLCFMYTDDGTGTEVKQLAHGYKRKK